MEMKQLILPTFPCLLLFFIHFSTTISAQSSALAPAPPGPTNITAILEKAGRFTILIRLLESTQSVDRINTQLNNSNQGLTIFAPADGAFANLKSGTLNSYTDEQKSELVQFHTLPSYMSIQQFQTASNPVGTEAGGTNYGQFPLNVTSSGTGVNITTGFVNASVVNTVYTDGQLAVYEVDQVLMPQRFFIAPPPPPPPAPAPAPSIHKKRSSASSSTVSSHAVGLNLMHEMFQASFLVAVVAAPLLFG
ncbi:OLC1v1034592C1 [Oldenlandia corymbosa var. corymbosa]|uniref:OLC1v1034592C1 n=1 Tax=Oldenlandia corymbosa var. corymbosa TaxID=529605 RepID=A0AAV1CSN6_OLDCO|nr:OLC1v1034592C1 [Oldenlandia corymbosa var. corymbosa]